MARDSSPDDPRTAAPTVAGNDRRAQTEDGLRAVPQDGSPAPQTCRRLLALDNVALAIRRRGEVSKMKKYVKPTTKKVTVGAILAATK
jgi:hypothetical protein